MAMTDCAMDLSAKGDRFCDGFCDGFFVLCFLRKRTDFAMDFENLRALPMMEKGHRVLQGAAQRGAQFCFILRFSGPFFHAAK